MMDLKCQCRGPGLQVLIDHDAENSECIVAVGARHLENVATFKSETLGEIPELKKHSAKTKSENVKQRNSKRIEKIKQWWDKSSHTPLILRPKYAGKRSRDGDKRLGTLQFRADLSSF